MVLRTVPAEGFILGFRAEYSVNSQTEPKTKSCFGLPKPSPILGPFFYLKKGQKNEKYCPFFRCLMLWLTIMCESVAKSV